MIKIKLVPFSVLLALTSTQACAVDFEILELIDKKNEVTLAVLGAPSFDPTTSLDVKTLVFGPQSEGFYPVKNTNPSKEDINADGYPDQKIYFSLDEAAYNRLRDGLVAQGELRGIFKDGIFYREFRAYDTVFEDDDPASSCAGINNSEGALIGESCSWQTAAGSSFKPIDLALLITEINQGLVNAGVEITPASYVVLETYGGIGRHGQNDEGPFCSASGGSDGPPGYTRSIWSVSDFESINSTILIYPGISGGTNGEGASSSVVSWVDLSSLTSGQLASTTLDAVANLGILAISGGGGGAGKGHITNSGTECHHGGAGGAGGIAISGTSGHVMGVGGAGTGDQPGKGGQGSGGTGHPDGTSGIGGSGALAWTQATSSTGTGGGPLWSGWSTSDDSIYTSTAFLTGAGGYNNNKGGSGGGGYGGGGAAKGASDNRKGGGGGGGSFAFQSSVADSADGVSSLILGNASGFSQQVTLTFQVTRQQ